MMPGKMLKVCRECPDNNLPECGKGGCDRRDAVLKQQKACRDAIAKDKADRAVYMDVAFRGQKKKVGQV